MTTTCFLWNQLSIHFLEHPNHFMVYVCYIILFAVPGIYFIFMPRKILLPPPFFFFAWVGFWLQGFFWMAQICLYPMLCILKYTCELRLSNAGNLYIPSDKCMMLSKWNMWQHFRFHSREHSNQSNQSSPRQWVK